MEEEYLADGRHGGKESGTLVLQIYCVGKLDQSGKKNVIL